MKRNRKRRYAVAALLAFIVATSSFAFAAANTVGASSAGIGTGTVGGYTASAISWTLAADPSNIASVKFTLNATATDVRARAKQGSTPLGTGTGWATCTVVTGNTFTCTLPGTVSTLSADTLEIAAAS